MAALIQPATEPQTPRESAVWAFLKRELAPTPDRFSAAVRITICAVIITLIGEAARSEALFLALFIILSLPRGYPKQTFKAAVSVFVAVVISAVAALILQALVADLSWARVLMIAASTFFAMLIGRKLNQPLAGALMSVLLTEPLLIYDSYSNPEMVVEGVLWFVLMLAFGLVTATAVEYLFPHPTALQRLTDEIAKHLTAASATFHQLSGQAISDEEQRQASTAAQLAPAGAASLRQAVTDVSSAGLLSGEDVLRVSSLLPGLELLTDLAGELGRYTAGDLTAQEREFTARLSEKTLALAKRLRVLNKPVERSQPESLAREEQGGTTPALLLSQSNEVLDALWNSWYLGAEFGNRTTKTGANQPKKSALSSEPFFARDNVRFALKISLAAIVCYILYNAVAWPGISTALVTCYVAALDTTGATYRKLALRLAGVAIGGLLFGIGGISLFLSNMDNVLELSLYVAVVFFLSGWIVKGSQRISYAGVQIGLSFSLVAMSSPTIPIQIQEARDRFLGVLFGAIVMWFVFRYLWPVDVIAEQRNQLAELIRYAVDLFQLALDDRPNEERLARLHEIRDSANRAISIANDQADASGYDSRHDRALQQSLRDCLTKTQALLMLAIIDAELSIEEAITNRGQYAEGDKLTAEYAGFLGALSDVVKTGNLEQLAGLAPQMVELQARSEQSTASDPTFERVSDDQEARHAQNLDRLARQIQIHVADLFRSIETLLDPQEPYTSTAKSRFSQRAASHQ